MGKTDFLDLHSKIKQEFSNNYFIAEVPHFVISTTHQGHKGGKFLCELSHQSLSAFSPSPLEQIRKGERWDLDLIDIQIKDLSPIEFRFKAIRNRHVKTKNDQ